MQYGLIARIFIAGTILARLVNDGSARREALALGGVALASWAAWLGAWLTWNGFTTLLILAFAMGMINRSLQGRSGYTVHTFVSGAVVTIGSDIADALSGRANWRQVLHPLSIWGAILCGALAGGTLTLRAGLLPGLVVPAVAVSGMALLALMGRWSRLANRRTGTATTSRSTADLLAGEMAALHLFFETEAYQQPVRSIGSEEAGQHCKLHGDSKKRVSRIHALSQ